MSNLKSKRHCSYFYELTYVNADEILYPSP